MNGTWTAVQNIYEKRSGTKIGDGKLNERHLAIIEHFTAIEAATALMESLGGQWYRS